LIARSTKALRHTFLSVCILFKPTVRAELPSFHSAFIVKMNPELSLDDDPFVSVELFPGFQFS